MEVADRLRLLEPFDGFTVVLSLLVHGTPRLLVMDALHRRGRAA